LTHSIFGINEGTIRQCLQYNYFTNFKFLAGHDFKINPDPDIEEELKAQIALEYLLKMFITLDIQIAYRIIKLRTFLLEAKAIIFDLDLLGKTNDPLFKIVEEVISLRKTWFTANNSKKELTNLVRSFYLSLGDLLKEEFRSRVFFLPKHDIKLSSNIEIRKGGGFSTFHKGYRFPQVLAFLGKRYFNLQNRANKFIYDIQFQIPQESSVQQKRFLSNREIILLNRKYYPYFGPMTSSLRIFNENSR